MRITPRLNEDVNEEWLSDRGRFQYDGLKRQRLNVPLVKVSTLFPVSYPPPPSSLSPPPPQRRRQLQPIGRPLRTPGAGLPLSRASCAPSPLCLQGPKGTLEATSWPKALAAVQQAVSKVQGAELRGVFGKLADAETLVAGKDLLNRLGSGDHAHEDDLWAPLPLSADVRCGAGGLWGRGRASGRGRGREGGGAGEGRGGEGVPLPLSADVRCADDALRARGRCAAQH